MVRKAILAFGAVALMAAGFAGSAQAAGTTSTFQPRVAGALGLFPSWRTVESGDIATGAPIPVVYHGGPVMNGGVTIHTIFWAPAGYSFEPGYETLFTDVAADSGDTSNLYSVLTQYGDESGVGTASPSKSPGDYSIGYDAANANDAIADTDAYPASAIQCASPNGLTTCITDGEIQNEIESVAGTHGNGRGMTNIWFVLLPQGVDECITGGACGTNEFAGYHSAMNVSGADGDASDVTIYGVIIDPSVEVGALPTGYEDPEGNPDAEATIDTLAHETAEAITDPQGDGWMDSNGYEVADKCEFGPEYGAELGVAADSSPYNELINGDEYLIQQLWSNDDGGCVQRTTQTSSPLPLPQVNLTQFSSSVSGNIGSHEAGVGVEVQLLRSADAEGDAVVVAEANTTTASNGNWSISLAPYAVGDDRDLIWVTYTGDTTLDPDLITTGSGNDPFTESGWTGWFDLDTGYDISNEAQFVSFGPCFQTGVLALSIGGTPQESPNDYCNTQTGFALIPEAAEIAPSQVVTMGSNDNRAFFEPIPTSQYLVNQTGNPDGALVNMTITLGEPDAYTPYTGPLADSFPDQFGGPTGFPSCTADLEAGTADCTGLVPGNEYTVTRTRGSDGLSAYADENGSILVGPFSGTTPLSGGDTLALSNGSVTLTTLHVAHLVAQVSGEQTVLGTGSTCQPGLYYGPPLSAPPVSDFAGIDGSDGATLTGEICPLDGVADGLPTSAIEQTDDASGGQTQTEVADIEDTTPMEGEEVYGAFTALAEAGFPGENNTIAPSADNVAVSIAPEGGGGEVFSSSNVNTESGVAVHALAPGTYDATWTWSDSNGDSRTVVTRFVEAAAVTGPAGPAGKNAKVTCKIKSSKKIVCTVTYPKAKSGSVLVRIARRATVAALGRASLRHGRATVALLTRGRVASGRWTVTLVRLGASGSAQTTTVTVRLR
jgi:hypothetical protein